MLTKKMKIEIWSDVVCLFCYIGKQKLDQAIAQVKDAPEVEFVWKSYELLPGLAPEPGKDFYTVMAEVNGISREQAIAMCDQATDMAKQAGLVFKFDIMVPANSFNASRLAHFAKQHGLQTKVKEALFRAYFTEGKNINDIDTLAQIAADAGLDAAAVKAMLDSDAYADEVRNDIAEAKQKGITSIPYYVFNDKTVAKGAQSIDTFAAILEEAIADWRIEGQACKIGESCM